jgi:hypothetical protein
VTTAGSGVGLGVCAAHVHTTETKTIESSFTHEKIGRDGLGARVNEEENH